MLRLSKPLNDVNWQLKDRNWHEVANTTFLKLTQTKQFCTYKVQNDPCSAPHKAGYLGHPFYVPVRQRMTLSSPWPSLHLSVTLPKGILAAVPYISLAQKLQCPSAVPWDEEREETPDCLHTILSHVRSSHHLSTHGTLQQMRRNLTLCWQDYTSPWWCCQELCWALAALII